MPQERGSCILPLKRGPSPGGSRTTRSHPPTDLSPFPPHGGRLGSAGRAPDGSAGDAGSAPRDRPAPHAPRPLAERTSRRPPPPPPGTLRPRTTSTRCPFPSRDTRARQPYFRPNRPPDCYESPLGSQARGHSPGSAPPAGRGAGPREARRRPVAGCPGGRRGSFGPLPGRRRLYPPPGTDGGAARPLGRRGGSPARAAPRATRRRRGSDPFSVAAAVSREAF